MLMLQLSNVLYVDGLNAHMCVCVYMYVHTVLPPTLQVEIRKREQQVAQHNVYNSRRTAEATPALGDRTCQSRSPPTP